MITVLFQYFLGQTAIAILILLGFKFILKKKCNIEISYTKYVLWLFKIVQECFKSMFETINKFKK